MKNSYIKSKPTRIIAVVTIAVLCCCLIIFSGCPLPWYVPVKYSDKKMQQIYGFIKNGLLTDCDNYIATSNIPTRMTRFSALQAYSTAEARLCSASISIQYN